MPEDRRLAAIMFTDIVGYTALMGSDEDKAFQLLRKNRDLQRPLIKKYRGEWLKEMGDGILASFPSASDAVRCAGEIQHAAGKEEIPLRIGIHEGEVVFEGSDVLGDGVNVASRLEELAEEGGIYISGAVYKDIKNKSGIISEFIEEKILKNVEEPIKIYRAKCDAPKQESEEKTQPGKLKNKNLFYLLGLAIIIIVAFLIWYTRPIQPDIKLEKSIAVLPFTNLSDNTEDQYLADGVNEAILNHLQRIDELRVRSSTSTRQYRNTTKNIIQIGQELDVNYILEGSFQKVGDQANLIVQLIEAKNDVHLWAKEYNRDWSDIFLVQKEIARMIADELYANISKEAKEGIDVIPTDNMTAYEYYLKGNEIYWQARGTYDINKIYESIKYFNRAIDLDDKFSLAYISLGRGYWTLAHAELESKKLELWKNAKETLEKAIRLDPYNGWAYSEMGVVLHNWNWDSTAARLYYDMALKLAPNDWNVYRQYMVLEKRLGHCEKVERLLNTAKDRFPNLNQMPWYAENIDLLLCQQKWKKFAVIAEDNWDALGTGIQSFMAYLYDNNLDKADQAVKIMKEGSRSISWNLCWDGLLYAKKGEKNPAYQAIDSLRQISTTEFVPNVHYAAIYAALGEKDQMYKYLDLALLNREFRLHMLHVSYSVFIPYQHEDRFREIWRKSWIPLEDKE
jgi:TolB-like protein/class 3 adenylate cyclase